MENNTENTVKVTDGNMTTFDSTKTIDEYIYKNNIDDNNVNDTEMKEIIPDTPLMLKEKESWKDENVSMEIEEKVFKDEEIENNIGDFWKTAIEKEREMKEIVNEIKEENSSVLNILNHNHVEKRSAEVFIPVHVERFPDEDLVAAKTSSSLATASVVFVVLGLSASILLLAMAVLIPLLYRKFMEKTSKGDELPHYPGLEMTFFHRL